MNASDHEARVVADFAGDVRTIRPDLVRKANRLVGLRAVFGAAAFAVLLDLALFAIAARPDPLVPLTTDIVWKAWVRYSCAKKFTAISELDDACRRK